MKTLRNLAVATILAIAAGIINSQSMEAHQMMDCFQAQQQCAIVPGGYYAVFDEGCSADVDYDDEYTVWYWGKCVKDPNQTWGSSFYCQPFSPNGTPIWCG